MSTRPWQVVPVTLLLAVTLACNSSRTLDRKTADKLAEGRTLDSPAILILKGLNKANMRDAAAIRAFKRLSEAGLLRCNAKFTECGIGPRGRNMYNEGDAGIRVTIGYLTVDDVADPVFVDEHSAKSDVGAGFKPTPDYAKFHAEFNAILAGAPNYQPDKDATATVLFHRTPKGWVVEDVVGLKATSTTAWKNALPPDAPSGPTITNVARLATVTVSSENAEPGQSGTNAIDGTVAETPSEGADWASRGEPGAWIRLTWPSQVEVWEVVLYDRPNLRDNVTSGVLRFSDGSQLNVRALPNDGSPMRVEFDPRTVTWIEFKVATATGGHPGLQEMEVFGTKL